MADSPNYDVHLRRRREGRTNYKSRLEMLKSGEHRAVVRISNKHAQVQIIAYTPDGDDVAVSAISQQLQQYGWDENTGNLPAAYLTGFLAGYRAQVQGITRAVPDLGVRDQQYASRYYAALQGLRDAGIDVSIDDTALPSEGRVAGEHADGHESSGIAKAFDTVKQKIEQEYGEE